MKKAILILSAINTVITVLFLVFTGVIRILTDIYLPLGALLVLPIIILVVYVCEAVLLFLMISMLLSSRARTLSTVLLITLTLLVIFLPVTKAYGIVNYKLFYELRAEIIESAADIDKSYPQIDMETYFINDIRISYSGSVIVHSENGETVMIFDLFSGLAGQTALVYSSSSQDILSAGTAYQSEYFKSISRIDDHWYFGVYK